jgi:FHS family L-fucose permease-like MFS transporter
MPIVERRFRTLYAALFALCVLFGTSMTIIGATLPKILADFGWSYATAGAVIAASAFVYFLTTLAGGTLMRRLGPKAVIAGGLSFSVLGLAFFAASPRPLPNLLLNACIGVGSGVCELIVSWSVLRMDSGGTGRAMSLMHGAFALGAVTGPLAIGLMMGAGLPWTAVYRGMAALFALLVLGLLCLPFSRLGREEDARKAGGFAELSRRSAYWLGFASLLLYVGVESGISNWIAEFAVRVAGVEPGGGAILVSLFWIGLLAGRFGAPLVFKGRQDVPMVASAVLLAAAAACLAITGYAKPPPAASVIMALAALCGLGCSIVYPSVVSLVGASFPAHQADAVFFAIAGGGLGAFIFPFLMSWISEALGIRAGIAAYAAFAALVAASTAALARAYRREAARR